MFDALVCYSVREFPDRSAKDKVSVVVLPDIDLTDPAKEEAAIRAVANEFAEQVDWSLRPDDSVLRVIVTHPNGYEWAVTVRREVRPVYTARVICRKSPDEPRVRYTATARHWHLGNSIGQTSSETYSTAIWASPSSAIKDEGERLAILQRIAKDVVANTPTVLSSTDMTHVTISEPDIDDPGRCVRWKTVFFGVFPERQLPFEREEVCPTR